MFVLPVERDNPTRHRHYALWALIAANMVVFLPTWLLNDYLQIFQTYGLVPAQASLFTAGTSMFLHAGWMHLLGNMLFLMMFGDNIEDVVGPVAFLLAYLLGGFAAVFAYLPFHAASTVPLVGASGAISAVVGMYLVFFPYAKADLVIYFWRFEVTAIRTTIIGAIAAWFAEQVALMLFAEFTSLGQFVRVAFSAHVGGFLAGAACGLLFLALGYVSRYVGKGPRNPVFGYVSQPALPARNAAPRTRTRSSAGLGLASIGGAPTEDQGNGTTRFALLSWTLVLLVLSLLTLIVAGPLLRNPAIDDLLSYWREHYYGPATLLACMVALGIGLRLDWQDFRETGDPGTLVRLLAYLAGAIFVLLFLPWKAILGLAE